VRLELRLACLVALAIQPWGSAARAQSSREPFTVGDSRIEGLQRISEGTVFNYLPVNIGDHLDGQRIGEAMRALYATGFFREVELRRDGNTLLVVVVERPSIAKFELKGNKDIKTEDLQKSLRNVGLAQGKTFDRSVLDEVKQYLTDQYYSRGKYAVRVDTKITELPGNKVDIIVDIKEGKRAKIEQINLVGNTKFKEKDVLNTFELKTPNWLSWYKQDDRYSRESLQGDLEKLRSFYMDRGYANFQIESTQVAIAPEKDDMYITVNVNEGDVFRVSEIKLAGTMVVPEAQLRALLQIKPGDIFSRKAVTSSQQLMSYRLGADGYAFAKIDPVPTPDNIRGYRESRLGPKDNIGVGNPYGGNFRIVNRLELIFPVPDKWRSAARVSWFYDIGNVFQTGSKVKFLGVDDITPVNYHFNYDNLKRSTGIAVQWLAPLGLFRFSYGIPLNAFPGNTVIFGDETERFQFSIGQAF
jgi:outer membrane protein insertion porin family